MFRALGWRIKSSHFSNSYSAPHITRLIAAEFVRTMRAELTRLARASLGCELCERSGGTELSDNVTAAQREN